MGANTSKPKQTQSTPIALQENLPVKRKADDRVGLDTHLPNNNQKKQRNSACQVQVKDFKPEKRRRKASRRRKWIPKKRKRNFPEFIERDKTFEHITNKQALASTALPTLEAAAQALPTPEVTPSPPPQPRSTGVIESDPYIILTDSDEEKVADTSKEAPAPAPAPPKNNGLLFKIDRIELYKKELDCLQPRRWLNDNVIGAYLSLLKEKYPEFYIFDSLFFDKLLTIHNSDAKHKEYYKETARWFKSADLTSKKLWIIPICNKNHWYIVAVNSPGSEKPRMIIMDSIQKPIEEYEAAKIIKKFLEQTRKAKRIKRSRRANILIANIPQQTNGYDCGLYLLRSATILAEKRKEIVQLVKNKEANTFNNPIYDQEPVPTRLILRQKFNNRMNNSN